LNLGDDSELIAPVWGWRDYLAYELQLGVGQSLSIDREPPDLSRIGLTTRAGEI
jgi:hypothetical protein